MTHPYTTDEADYRRLCDFYIPQLNRCAGGRLRVAGLPCIHCHAVNPPFKCFSPTTAHSPTEPAPVPPPGRRVLIDGRECTLVELEGGR